MRAENESDRSATPQNFLERTQKSGVRVRDGPAETSALVPTSRNVAVILSGGKRIQGGTFRCWCGAKFWAGVGC